MNIEEIKTGAVLLIDKEENWTSFDVVNKIRIATKAKKVGHAGTLDPLATGLLIICTGKETKNISQYQGQVKEYTGIITLGATTPSYDLETESDTTYDYSYITEKDVLETAESFVGWQHQIAPAFSAVKQDGIKNYKRARRGEKVPDRKRWIKIEEFEVTKVDLPDVHFKIKCSKGTYIRTIAFDFGRFLNNGAHLKFLTRTAIGEHKLSDALKVNNFLNSIVKQQ